MKPTSHDPLDDLIVAALHGEITPAERAQLDARLASDPAARAVYQEAQLMHDLLEKTHTTAQPDSGFEQRMVSGVRRKITDAQRPPETAWQSLVILWTGLNNIFGKSSRWKYGLACVAVCVVAFSVAMISGNQAHSTFTTISGQLSAAQSGGEPDDVAADNSVRSRNPAPTDESAPPPPGATLSAPGAPSAPQVAMDAEAAPTHTADALVVDGLPAPGAAAQKSDDDLAKEKDQAKEQDEFAQKKTLKSLMRNEANAIGRITDTGASFVTANGAIPIAKPTDAPINAQDKTTRGNDVPLPQSSAAPTDLTRKLIRNAELDLEVKSFQSAMDQIAALTKTAGGYVDSDNSQRGGNGKLQGAVVVKVLPENLDDFLLKLRDLGEIRNQTISTEDVTKEYVDLQARVENDQRMETQLQQLLQRDTNRVSDLLMVERELGRVRGEIEQMQGQLKLYDFQVQYATVTMRVSEKDLNQAAAYLLKEQDNFSLLTTDVEATFQQVRHAADDFKAQVLTASLTHNSGSDVSAQLDVMVPPDQIEPFLTQIRTLGRVANFTRQTQRVARDGGDSDEPADETLTEKDKVEVQLTISSDDESRKQVTLAVVTPAVDSALDQAKSAALANAGVEILSSSLQKTQDGQTTGALRVRVPGKSYRTLLDAFRALGRTASFTLQRDDDSGPGATGDDEPVILNLSLTDDETPLQQTQLSVVGDDVDNQGQQLKQEAVAAGIEIKASSFQRQPDGTETAQMTFLLPMAKYPAFVETLKKLGKVESLTVNRNDRPDEARTDDAAPAEIDFTLHNQADIVADNSGLWATVRQTFSDGAGALFGSVRTIGVVCAFLLPWLVVLVIVAWTGRRIYVWCKG